MSLRARLKQKEAVDEENAALKEEVAELRAKNAEHERRKVKLAEEAKEWQAQIAILQKENKGLREEIS